MPQETGRYELIGRLFDDHERAWLAWCAPIRDTGAVLYSTGDPGAIGLCPLMTDPAKRERAPVAVRLAVTTERTRGAGAVVRLAAERLAAAHPNGASRRVAPALTKDADGLIAERVSPVTVIGPAQQSPEDDRCR